MAGDERQMTGGYEDRIDPREMGGRPRAARGKFRAADGAGRVHGKAAVRAGLTAAGRPRVITANSADPVRPGCDCTWAYFWPLSPIRL